MSQPALSTAGYGPLLRRSLGRAALGAFAIAGGVILLAIGPRLGVVGPAIARALVTQRPHAPNLAPILHASLAIQIHLASILAAMAVTGVLLAGVKGDRLHRLLGWAWAVTMVGTAISTLFIRAAPIGPSFHGLGLLHLFALLTFVSVPRAVLAARRHDVARHAAVLSGFVVGGLGIAGIAAFLPGRMLWQVLFG
ncbi:MAG: hypothetical protein JWP86_665 [Phenylobacterium sp.]|nr:hypothetical protein [Phenylobacterium sp.]MDB5493328.1 hypothetical protein [Phenylobacterium sp.]